MNPPIIVAPTKSLCRVSNTRCVVVNQRQALRRQHLCEFKFRAKLTSESIGSRNGKDTNPHFRRVFVGRQNGPSLSSTKSIKIRRPLLTASFSTTTKSSLALVASSPRDNKSTASKVTAAVAILLGGTTYHLVDRNESLERENRNECENGTISPATMYQTDVPSDEFVGTELSSSQSPMISIPLDLLSPILRHRPDNYNSGTNKSKLYRDKLFDDLVEGIKITIAPNRDDISSSMEPLRRQAVKNPISSQFHQPRNVMISRMRSIAGRGLHEKYKVDWDTVLGEGAYGSVHPARLALTGEKVALKKISKRYTNSSDFFSETGALLRIYENGGHPNISGLRDIVSSCLSTEGNAI